MLLSGEQPAVAAGGVVAGGVVAGGTSTVVGAAVTGGEVGGGVVDDDAVDGTVLAAVEGVALVVDGVVEGAVDPHPAAAATTAARTAALVHRHTFPADGDCTLKSVDAPAEISIDGRAGSEEAFPMKLRWHQRVTDHTEADRSSDDGGGQGAEYLDAPFRPVEDDEADRQSWYKARHWTTDEK